MLPETRYCHEQTATSNDQKVTSTKLKVTSNKQEVKSNEQKVTTNKLNVKRETIFTFMLINKQKYKQELLKSSALTKFLSITNRVLVYV